MPIVLKVNMQLDIKNKKCYNNHFLNLSTLNTQGTLNTIDTLLKKWIDYIRFY